MVGAPNYDHYVEWLGRQHVHTLVCLVNGERVHETIAREASPSLTNSGAVAIA